MKNGGHLKESKRGWRNARPAKATKTVPQSGQVPIIGSISRGEKSELYAKSSFFDAPKSWSDFRRPVYGFGDKQRDWLANWPLHCHLHRAAPHLLDVAYSFDKTDLLIQGVILSPIRKF